MMRYSTDEFIKGYTEDKDPGFMIRKHIEESPQAGNDIADKLGYYLGGYA